jgi:mono/diheme cytochrome c family protein
MSRHRIFPLLLASALVGVAASAGNGMRAQEPGRFDLRPAAGDTTGVYTEQQAADGLAVFTKTCSECHETKDVTGPDFRTKWKGRPVFALFEQIRTTMPDGNPGTLTREQYLSAVAYILKLNGLPAGPTPLASDSVALSAITLDLPSSH